MYMKETKPHQKMIIYVYTSIQHIHTPNVQIPFNAS